MGEGSWHVKEDLSHKGHRCPRFTWRVVRTCCIPTAAIFPLSPIADRSSPFLAVTLTRVFHFTPSPPACHAITIIFNCAARNCKTWFIIKYERAHESLWKVQQPVGTWTKRITWFLSRTILISLEVMQPLPRRGIARVPIGLPGIIALSRLFFFFWCRPKHSQKMNLQWSDVPACGSPERWRPAVLFCASTDLFPPGSLVPLCPLQFSSEVSLKRFFQLEVAAQPVGEGGRIHFQGAMY